MHAIGKTPVGGMVNFPLKAIFFIAAYSALHALVYLLYSARRAGGDAGSESGSASGSDPASTQPCRRATDVTEAEVRKRIAAACLAILALLVVAGLLIATH